MTVPIITYHSIDTSGSVISTTPDVFSRQMKHLSESGYTAVTLRDLRALLQNEADPPIKAVVLTFDDGFRNFYSEAFPILSKFNFSCTVFLVTDFCGKFNDWAGNPAGFPRSELLSWTEVRELDSYGIEFASHTRTHPDLTKLAHGEAQAEIMESKMAISDELSRETLSFAYPFGRSNAAVRRLAKTSFQGSCSTDLGLARARDDFSSLNRIDSYYLKNQRLFGMLSSSAFEKYLHFRQVMRNVKSMVATA